MQRKVRPNAVAMKAENPLLLPMQPQGDCSVGGTLAMALMVLWRSKLLGNFASAHGAVVFLFPDLLPELPDVVATHPYVKPVLLNTVS